MKSLARVKALLFAVQVIKLSQQLDSRKAYTIAKQLLRSGTSIGANLAESVDAESKRDFLHKVNIALKEARETQYWLQLLSLSELCSSEELMISSQLNEILAMLVATKKTIKQKLSKKEQST